MTVNFKHFASCQKILKYKTNSTKERKDLKIISRKERSERGSRCIRASAKMCWLLKFLGTSSE
jgi:hypothetical protein